jgi:tetratricopeptide (TPR) repeat protein
MSKKKVCQSCGLATFKDEAICPNCGERFSDNAAGNVSNDKQDNNVSNNLFIVCKNCGFGNEPVFNYCGKCGNALNDTKIKGKQPKTGQKAINKESALTSKLAYGIAVLFVVLIVVIIFINQKDKTPREDSGTVVNQGQMGPSVQAPQLNLMRVSELKLNLDKNPSDKNSILELANLYHDAGSLSQAISYYKKYLALDEKNADARIDMAICYFSSGDNETELKEINNALVYSPKHQKAFYNLGIISLNSGKFKESMEFFQKCYDLDPKTEVGIQSKELITQHKSAVK